MIRLIKGILVACVLLFLCPSGYAKGGHGGHGRGHSHILDLNHSEKSDSDVHVKSYVRKDGVVVQEHMRSAPDGDKSNNWSTKGNVNPYTGKVGTKSIESEVRSPAISPVSNDQPNEPKKTGHRFEMPADTIRKEAWLGVQKDMSLWQLRSQLGEPKSVSSLGGIDEWHYDDGIVRISNGVPIAWSPRGPGY
jgi:hypothetical protein